MTKITKCQVTVHFLTAFRRETKVNALDCKPSGQGSTLTRDRKGAFRFLLLLLFCSFESILVQIRLCLYCLRVHRTACTEIAHVQGP